MIVAEGRRLAEGLSGPRRAEALRLCDQVEQLNRQLSELCRNGMVGGATGRAGGRHRTPPPSGSGRRFRGWVIRCSGEICISLVDDQ